MPMLYSISMTYSAVPSVTVFGWEFPTKSARKAIETESAMTAMWLFFILLSSVYFIKARNSGNGENREKQLWQVSIPSPHLRALEKT